MVGVVSLHINPIALISLLIRDPFCLLVMYFPIFFLLKVLEEVKVSKEMDRDTLISVARTSLRTKLHTELADLLTEVTIQNT